MFMLCECVLDIVFRYCGLVISVQCLLGVGRGLHAPSSYIKS